MTKIAIVTGHSSGLGGAISRSLLDKGWGVVGVSRSSKANGLASKFGERLIEIMGSVDRQEVAEEAFSTASKAGDFRLLVNCAGQGVFGPIGGYTAKEIADTMSGNLLGLILFSDMAVQYFREHGGDIVNIMSTAGKKLRPDESVYVAAKWGAKGYTRTLRDAIKGLKLPIRVFEVYPCGMNTHFWAAATRPATNGLNFPAPESIAERIVDEVTEQRLAYCQELTFERG